MNLWRRLVRIPAIHFIVLGGLLFALDPSPPPSERPPGVARSDEEILLDEALSLRLDRDDRFVRERLAGLVRLADAGALEDAAGLEREVSALREAGYLPPLRSQQAIGYAELHDVAEGRLERGRAIELIKRNSRHYARRQLSWYRPDQTITWYPSVLDVDLAELERYLAGL